MSWIERKKKDAGSHSDLEIKKLKLESNVKQDFINFFSIPPLQSIAIINVAIGIWKQTDIRDAIRKHSLEYDPVGGSTSWIRGDSYDRSFGELEKSFLNKLSVLHLPQILKGEVANIKAPVLFEMLEWIRCERKDIEYMDSVCWTAQGTIDKVKTFEQLVKSHSTLPQHIICLFQLACTCCLEDSIFNLWDKLPLTIQKDIEEKMHTEYNYHLVAYWTSFGKNELSSLLCKIKPYDGRNLYNCNKNIYYNMVKLAISEGNILAVKYFWSKLTAEEINSNLEQWISDSLGTRKSHGTYQNTNEFADVLYFFLSQINCAEEQKDVFKKNSGLILKSLFLDWPWQRFLLPVIRAIWFSLDEKVYVEFLRTIANHIEESKTTEKLLRQLWLESPTNLKKHYIQYMINDHAYGTNIIWNLLLVSDVGTIKLILNYANAEEKKQITFSALGNDKFFNAIYAGKLSFFDVIIGETLSSNLDVQNLKVKVVQQYGDQLCYKWIYDGNWEIVEMFLHWAFISQDQIDSFKNNVINKKEFTLQILRDKGDYELVNQFLRWCFKSEQEIRHFKKNFAESKVEIVAIGDEVWGEFEKFLSWCFASDEDVNEFKITVLEGISAILSWKNFEFVDKLIHWCCNSTDEIKQFKAKFILSGTWLDLLQRIVSNYKLYDSDYSNLELSQKFFKLFSPLNKEVIINLKKKITKSFKHDEEEWYFRSDFRDSNSSPIDLKQLLRLIENEGYTPDDKENSDSDKTSENYDHSDNDNHSDSDDHSDIADEQS